MKPLWNELTESFRELRNQNVWVVTDISSIFTERYQLRVFKNFKFSNVFILNDIQFEELEM